ncbi:hypothetical protein [Roseobacter sp. HKCCD5988]|uniref:hypothetical protein n=1 Tax=Roseobacter sp. HKCCD5988 TaxID=3120338 RepID=UPI0030EE30E7
MFKKIISEFSYLKRDRYFYEKIIRNQFEIGFQNILIGANERFSPRFKGFSQGEEDFFLYVLSRILGLNSFLEFGVEDWRESNTRILSSLINGRYCVIDGSAKNITKIQKSREFYSANVLALQSWITVENINNLIVSASSALSTEFDVISVDLDGNDYWVLKEITCKPKVLIVEYNSLFGDLKKISTPYKEDFNRFSFDASGCIYGASFLAFKSLLSEKGYSLFHVSEMGNNMIFLQNDLVPLVVKIIKGSPCFREISYREMHENGVKSFAFFSDARKYVEANSSKYIDLDKGNFE